MNNHIPWVQCDPASVSRVADGLRALHGVCDECIVTVSPGERAAVLGSLFAIPETERPKIVPGYVSNFLATSTEHGHAAGLGFQCADCVAKFMGSWFKALINEFPASYWYVLDLEPALGPFHEGKVKFDLDPVVSAWKLQIEALPKSLGCYMPQRVAGKTGTAELARAFGTECLRPTLTSGRIRDWLMIGCERPRKSDEHAWSELTWHWENILIAEPPIEHVVVKVDGLLHGKPAYTPEEFANKFHQEPKIINTANAEWPQVAEQLRDALKENNMPANGTIMVSRFALERELAHIATAGFPVRAPIAPAGSFIKAGAPSSASPPSTAPLAPLQHPIIPTGSADNILLGRDNGQTVLVEGKRYLEVAVQMQNVDSAGVPIVHPIHALALTAPIRLPDKTNPLRSVTKEMIRRIHTTPYNPGTGDDERLLVGDFEIPATSLIAPGVPEWTWMLFPVPDNVLAGQDLAVGLAMYR